MKKSPEVRLRAARAKWREEAKRAASEAENAEYRSYRAGRTEGARLAFLYLADAFLCPQFPDARKFCLEKAAETDPLWFDGLSGVYAK